MNCFSRIWLWYSEMIKVFRSYLFCFKYLPYEQAKKLPIFFDMPVKVKHLVKGSLIIKGEISKRQIWFGPGLTGMSNKLTVLDVSNNSQIIFKGRAYIASGCILRTDRGAKLEFGDNFGMNCNSFIKCSQSIILGKNVLLGWDNEIIDYDGHEMWLDNIKQPACMPIKIGDHVWITSHVRIGKGIEIANDCVVAKGAIVTKSQGVSHSLIGGVPARIIRGNVRWEK